MPQGSCVDPILHSIYASTMRYIVPGEMSLHRYADHHVTKLSFSANDTSAETSTLRALENCAEEIHLWMSCQRSRNEQLKT